MDPRESSSHRVILQSLNRKQSGKQKGPSVIVTRPLYPNEPSSQCFPFSRRARRACRDAFGFASKVGKNTSDNQNKTTLFSLSLGFFQRHQKTTLSKETSLTDSSSSVCTLSNSFSFCFFEIRTAVASAFFGAVEFTVVCANTQ